MNDDKYSFISVYLLTVIAFAVFFVSRCSCTRQDVQSDTIFVEKWDTAYIEKHDTLPAEKGKVIVKYVTIPNTDMPDSVRDEPQPDGGMPMAIVQKQYSDDSTYTAYVSGIDYKEYPKLDSVIVRQREITHTVRETITVKKKSHWHVGLQGGYGYGFLYKGFEPYVGVGVTYGF